MIILFDFPETLNEAHTYEKLGFDIVVDDPISRIFSAEKQCNTDAIGILTLLHDCMEEKLFPHIQINETIYCFEDGLKIIDKMSGDDVYIDGIGTIL